MRPLPKAATQSNSTESYRMVWNVRAMKRMLLPCLLVGLALVFMFCVLREFFRVARASAQMERCYDNVKKQVNALEPKEKVFG
jgi:hypothetical protein